jgi:hypothetical protein
MTGKQPQTPARQREAELSDRVKQPPFITLSEPFPLLDPGQYVARCSEASYAWARQWKKWMARLVLEPQNYQGRPYTGRLCKFLGLGKDPERPFAGPQSEFRRLYVEVNCEQPTNPDASIKIFEGRLYEITVETVTKDRKNEDRKPEHWYSIVRVIHPCKSISNAAPTPQLSNLELSNSLTQRTETTLSTDPHRNTENTPLTVSEASSSFFSKKRRH